MTKAQLYALLTEAYTFGRLESQAVPRSQPHIPVPKGRRVTSSFSAEANAQFPEAMLSTFIPPPLPQGYGGVHYPPPSNHNDPNGGGSLGPYSIPASTSTTPHVNAANPSTLVDWSPSTSTVFGSQSWSFPVTGCNGVAQHIPPGFVDFNANFAAQGALDGFINRPEEDEEALEDVGREFEFGSALTSAAASPAVNATAFSMGSTSMSQQPPVAQLQESPIQFENLGPCDFTNEPVNMGK
ncbi:hypothetical protein MD484_g4492, partial [Candolleomyces efflorescens]